MYFIADIIPLEKQKQQATALRLRIPLYIYIYENNLYYDTQRIKIEIRWFKHKLVSNFYVFCFASLQC